MSTLTPRDLCTPGRFEPLKTGVHLMMLIGATVCCLYNASAWICRRETHSAVNAVIYGGLAWLEVMHAQHHAEAIGSRAAGAAVPLNGGKRS